MTKDASKAEDALGVVVRTVLAAIALFIMAYFIFPSFRALFPPFGETPSERVMRKARAEAGLDPDAPLQPFPTSSQMDKEAVARSKCVKEKRPFLLEEEKACMRKEGIDVDDGVSDASGPPVNPAPPPPVVPHR